MAGRAGFAAPGHWAQGIHAAVCLTARCKKPRPAPQRWQVVISGSAGFPANMQGLSAAWKILPHSPRPPFKITVKITGHNWNLLWPSREAGRVLRAGGYQLIASPIRLFYFPMTASFSDALYITCFFQLL